MSSTHGSLVSGAIVALALALLPAAVSAADLREGAFDGTRWNETRQGLELDPSRGDARTGTFTSGVLDAGEGRVFVTLAWWPDLAYGVGLPERESVERGYPGGNADLRGTLALERGAAGASAGAVGLGLGTVAKRSESVTVFGWMRVSDVDALAKIDRGTGPGIRIGWSDGTRGLEAVLRGAGGRDVILSGPSNATLEDRAHHVALVFDRNAGEAILYVDGGVVDRAPVEHASPAPRGVVEVAGMAPAPFGPGVPELAAVARALSQDEILALARRGLGSVRVQVARCEDQVCSGAEFVGPDGTAGSYFGEQGPASIGPPEWRLAAIHAGRLIRYRVVLDSADATQSPLVAAVVARPGAPPLDNAVAAPTCTTPSEATSLALSGNTTSFSWSPPSSPGDPIVVYDVLRATQPNAFGSGNCLIPNTAATSPPDIDASTPAPVFYYLVRAKNPCGDNLGTDSNLVPRTGTACLLGTGAACAFDAQCVAGNGCCGVCTALNTVNNCGSCGNVCPGQTATSDASCVSGSTCAMTCNGENYDVNANPADGCEQADNPTGQHTAGTAASLGSHACNDSDTFAGNGIVPSDSRTHSPAVTGFNTSAGAAPDFFKISATGGTFCTNDLSITLLTSGGGATPCYRLTVQTNLHVYTCQTTGAGSCSIMQGSGSYSDGSTVLLVVEKICSLPVVERVAYSVSGHL